MRQEHVKKVLKQEQSSISRQGQTLTSTAEVVSTLFPPSSTIFRRELFERELGR